MRSTPDRALASLFVNLSVVVAGLGLAPALYLRYRALADPQGVVDGLLRLTWFSPIVFLLALTALAGGRISRARGLIPIYLPLTLVLSAVGVLAFGWTNDGSIVVAHPPRELTRAEKIRLARGEPVYQEAQLPWISPVATWAHTHLPRQPFGAPPAKPAPLPK
jgi:hypothetical protein